MDANHNPRGSLWNRWEPHIHAPGTILSDQYTGPNPWEDFLSRIEKSNPSIRTLGVTDYYGVELYQEVLERQKRGRLKEIGLIFPNVEMRLGIETSKGSAINIHLLFSSKGSAINIHLLFSPEDPEHVERIKGFFSELHFEFQQEAYRCDKSDLIRLGKAYDESIKDDRKALEAGVTQFKVNFNELRDAFKKSAWAQQNTLVAVAAGSTDGTSGLKEDKSFTALRREIETFAQIIFSGQPQQREFWLGRGAVGLEELEKKWGGRKPCLHGSDAHTQGKVASPDLNRFCWVKGDLTFESLRQACVEPERAFVNSEPPTGALASQTIAQVGVTKANWLKTNPIPLNPGLISIIGARGSGKTALADFIAAGGNALSSHPNDASFVRRAAAHLTSSTSTLKWDSGDTTSMPLIEVESEEPADSPRVQYLSQQFVEQLCSAEGLEDDLLTEIERVIFQSHPIDDKMGASSFRELLDIRSARARSARDREESALQAASESLTAERARRATLPSLVRQVDEKTKSIERDKRARKALTTKGTKERVQRLEEVSLAADAVRQKVEFVKARQRALLELGDAVGDFRHRSAPVYLRELRKKYADAALTAEEWNSFRLDFVGNVDAILTNQIKAVEAEVKLISGPSKGEVEPNLKDLLSANPFIEQGAKLAGLTLTLLEKEANRLRQLVGIDSENVRKFKQLSEKIMRDESSLAKLEKEIAAARSSDDRIGELIQERQDAYAGIFDAVADEERELTELYSPLRTNLQSQGGELRKLSFSVRRSVDVHSWATTGENLLDLRKLGPFKGKGSLEETANVELLPAWARGTSSEVAEAMTKFRERHEQALLDHSPVERKDHEGFARWGRSISDWLYSTSHVKVSYALQYDGVDIEQLSPGTRGIVLLLLYVAIDTDDDRPLIIDQPEENLDPKSIYEDLVERFKAAKCRRQIIIITHNANLVVNTDADQVIISKCGPHRPGYLPELSYESGGLENPYVRRQVCEILEGGEIAFKERAKRLRLRI